MCVTVHWKYFSNTHFCMSYQHYFVCVCRPFSRSLTLVHTLTTWLYELCAVFYEHEWRNLGESCVLLLGRGSSRIPPTLSPAMSVHCFALLPPALLLAVVLWPTPGGVWVAISRQVLALMWRSDLSKSVCSVIAWFSNRLCFFLSLCSGLILLCLCIPGHRRLP